MINVLEEDVETAALRAKKRCPICETAMDAYLIDDKRKLHVCGNNPNCEGFIVEEGEFKVKGYEGPTVECDKCGSDMVLKNGRFGKYMGCTNDACKNTRKILKNGEVAPPKEEPVHFPELPCEIRMRILCCVMVHLACSLRRAISLNRVKRARLWWKS